MKPTQASEVLQSQYALQHIKLERASKSFSFLIFLVDSNQKQSGGRVSSTDSKSQKKK